MQLGSYRDNYKTVKYTINKVSKGLLPYLVEVYYLIITRNKLLNVTIFANEMYIHLNNFDTIYVTVINDLIDYR